MRHRLMKKKEKTDLSDTKQKKKNISIRMVHGLNCIVNVY